MNAERQKILEELWAEGRRLIIKDGEKEVPGTCNMCGVKGKYIADADDDGEWTCMKCAGWGSDSEEEVDVDDRDAPNIYPYKKCSVCGDRKSCGNYKENDWFCEDCDEAPKPVVLCADCGDAIPDTENLDKCWTNDGETFWCEGCRESHVEEYIGERDGDD